MASYSTWLLEVLKLNCKNCRIRMFLGSSRMMPAPAPCGFKDLSTYIVNHYSLRGLLLCWSLVKSAKHLALWGCEARS